MKFFSKGSAVKHMLPRLSSQMYNIWALSHKCLIKGKDMPESFLEHRKQALLQVWPKLACLNRLNQVSSALWSWHLGKSIFKKGNNFKTIHIHGLKQLKSVRMFNTQIMEWQFKVKTAKWMEKQVLSVHFQKIRYCL